MEPTTVTSIITSVTDLFETLGVAVYVFAGAVVALVGVLISKAKRIAR